MHNSTILHRLYGGQSLREEMFWSKELSKELVIGKRPIYGTVMGSHRILRCNLLYALGELTDATLASWIKSKLDQAFLPVDATAISSIPLCTRQMDDFWSWHYEKRRIFSVRSAYRVLGGTITLPDSTIRFASERCSHIFPFSGCGNPNAPLESNSLAG
jgi:hypothetical protein